MDVSDSAIRILSTLLEVRTGQQLSVGRHWRIETALSALMRARGIDSVDQLVTALARGRDPSLTEDVVEGLLNNETYFFRDRRPFDLLFDGALDRVARARDGERRLAIWCAGCSTGQEAYSLAMAFAEDPARWAGWSIDILGTDVSRAAVTRAREGLYSQFEVQRGLSAIQTLRWFEQEGGGWRISPQLRDAVRFDVHSLTEAAPPGAFDLILCRNVLLYFGAETRRAVFDRLAGAAGQGAFLMLGAAETVIGQTSQFAPDPALRGLYLRVEQPQPAQPRILADRASA
ncbi:MAG: protein-glutamate O-methyltransferase CheR [Alphaproteobacteria bacterium]|nr:protein-glutamate O-methyltransferase CheR [Alphaproteobacteria bacterium]